MKRKRRRTDAAEKCGIILKDGTILTAPNRHEDPSKGFRIGGDFVRPYLENMAGTWHTHPQGSAALSQEDYLGFSQWPGYTHYIVGHDGVRAYIADDEGLITEVDLASN